MAQSTRIFGAALATCSIGGTSYVLSAERITIKFENDTQKATALKDGWEYPVGIRGKWSSTATFFINTSSTTGEGGPGGTLWTKALANAQVAFSCTDNEVSGAVNTLSGSAIITECEQAIGDEAQKINVTLMGQGALTSTIA